MAITPSAIFPGSRNEQYTVGGAVLKFFEEKTKDFAKSLGYTGFWLGQAIPNLPPEVKSFSATMSDFKNFIAVTEVPKKVVETLEAISGVWTSVTSSRGSCNAALSALRETFKKTTSLTNSVVDSLDFSSRFIAISNETMTWLKGISFAATLGGAVNGACEQLEKIYQNFGSAALKTSFYVANFMKDACYVGVGGMGLYCTLTATPIVPWMMVGLLTTALGLTIGNYFVEKLYDPEGKGRNLNPEVVISNRIQSGY